MIEDDGLERDVRALVATVLKIAPVPEAPIERVSCGTWDSLRHVEIVFALEDRFDVQFDEEEFPRMDSTEAIAQMIRARLGS
ncbi:MAG: acyl carrier protein [Burkholderiales bacterium]